MKYLLTVIFLLGLSPAICAESSPGDSSVWLNALHTMVEPHLNTQALAVSNLTLTAEDFAFHIDSGTIHWFEPIRAEGHEYVYGGVFVGRGWFRFSPGPNIEKDQLRKFFETDSLDRFVTTALIHCNDSLMRLVNAAAVPVDGAVKWKRRDRTTLDRYQDLLTRKENYYHLYAAFRNAVYPRPEPYLAVCAQIDDGLQAMYRYDPYKREQVRFFREYFKPGEHFFELVCSYVRRGYAETGDINGKSTDQYDPVHYDIAATIENSGEVIVTTEMSLAVIDSAARFIRMVLHRELEVDSVFLVDDRTPVEFARYQNENNKSEALYVFLPDEYLFGDTVRLQFYYHGDIARREVGEFLVEAGASWYPRHGYGDHATYDLSFKTPKDLTFLVSGTRTDSTVVGDTLMTTWRVDTPVWNISFNIGYFDRHDFPADSGTQAVIYYNEGLHRSFLKHSDRDAYREVGRDVRASLDLFDSLYGACMYDTLVIAEIVYSHGEAFPGFIHMGANTFVGTDRWGADHLFRSHEVAHQWWGSTVGFATYHDQWLSEGLAEYSSLVYLKQAEGEKRFYDKVKEYRDDVFSARKYLFFDGAESGPIILGQRTASSETEGDYQLIVYRKAALILHMLRCQLMNWETLDDSRFYEALREFYTTFAGRNATTAEFVAIMSSHATDDLDWFFQQWIYGTYLPEYRFSYEVFPDSSEGWRVACMMQGKDVPAGFRVDLPVEIELESGTRLYRSHTVIGNGGEFDLTCPEKPRRVKANPFMAILAKVKQ